jgi:2,3-bisphosphoglycerate-dependent phosphoglycerate mutase
LTTLLIARHGNTFAPGDTVTRVGKTDLPLVESGRLQGRLLGTYLKHHQLIPDVIFTSQLKRTQQTAQEAQRMMGISLPIQPLSIFDEIDYGQDENQPEDTVIKRLGVEAIKAWENHTIVPPGWNVNPDNIIHNWQVFADHLREMFKDKICLVITSNGIARFSPYLTGDFSTFSTQHTIKIATGALCVFINQHQSELWECQGWNIIPA